MARTTHRTWLALAMALGLTATSAHAQTSDPRSQTLDNRRRANTSGWKGALSDSLRLLTIEHVIRVAFQEKTRAELDGPFFSDYHRSVKLPRTWNDGDGWQVNYVGHPIHGAMAGFIWLDHDSGYDHTRVQFDKAYWASVGRATIWAASYSVQFEFGPLSEASIGNVGLHPNTTGWTDHVMTPAGAFAMIVGEDAVDRYVILRIESMTRNPWIRAIARVGLNPSRSLSAMSVGRMPWSRPGRPLR